MKDFFTWVKYCVDKKAFSATNTSMSWDNIGGKPVGMFRGIPCHTTDGLVDTESAIS